jgi:hypothetical protein
MGLSLELGRPDPVQGSCSQPPLVSLDVWIDALSLWKTLPPPVNSAHAGRVTGV